MKLIYNAGHHNKDTGAIVGNYVERDLNKKIRDELKKINPDALYVPDDLILRESIAWTNKQAEPDDIAIDIHLNKSNNKTIRGVECYYSDNKELAKIVSKRVAENLDIPNKGAVHDSKSYVGSLGWCRNVKCNSVVLECGYLSNSFDLNKIIGNEDKIAKGIYEATAMPAEEVLQKKVSELQKVIDSLIRFITTKLSH